MRKFRFVGGIVQSALLLSLFAVCTSKCVAQSMTPNTTPGTSPSNTTPGTTPSTQGQTNQPAQANAGTVVAAPGATVVVQPPPPASTSTANPSNNNGLIVAGPGSTVVVQPPSPTAAAAKPNTTQSHSFSTTDTSVVKQLVDSAKHGKNVLVCAGCIDALGNVGGDTSQINLVVTGLTEVLKQEFNGDRYTDRLGADSSEFLCFHAVQALGKLGWGAKGAIPQMQLLLGQNVILDGAIATAVTAIQSGPVPQPPASGTTTTAAPSTAPSTSQTANMNPNPTNQPQGQ
jgi:hypothetical protein